MTALSLMLTKFARLNLSVSRLAAGAAQDIHGLEQGRRDQTAGDRRPHQPEEYPVFSRLLPLFCRKVQPGAHVGLDVGVGKFGRQEMGGSPAGAVAGDYHIGRKENQLSDGLGDDALEEAAGEVKAAHHRVDLVHPSDALSVP